MWMAVDARSMRVSVALGNAHGPVRTKAAEAGPAHREVVLPLMEDLLASVPGGARGLDGVGAVLGPGGFTGIRTALAACLALQRVTGTRLFGADAFTLAAFGAGGPVGVLLPAQRGEALWAVLEGMGDGAFPELRIGPFLVPEDAVREGPDRELAELAWCGEALPVQPWPRMRVAGWFAGPQPLAQNLVLAMRAGTLRPLDPSTAQPLYHRPSDAEAAAGIGNAYPRLDRMKVPAGA